MGIILWIIFGALSGWVATKLMKTDPQHRGFLSNMVLGILGALLGGFIVSFFGGSGVTGFNIYSFLVAIFGSIVVIWLIRVLKN